MPIVYVIFIYYVCSTKSKSMRKFTLQQYRTMARHFNKMSFKQKIQALRDNSDILILGSDHNWWVIKCKDKEIQEQMEDECDGFTIENEWDSNEIHVLIDLLGMETTDI